ncbi:FG-GAP-like repeat-containing protein [Dyadobacter sp. CY261]|uniref:FG-GAP-like repeat-containing protein n=1 Tax=Dyadobacter sp. CY261 TaxID=2907203 RepID=UPI001F2979EF|nr:FG-GAP-like repeat-containing protein [Dyadobacter sp. CY261]MCF0075688.1 FG-GAP-like repeat-containing protein [Dyadobacter sp. CY261]
MKKILLLALMAVVSTIASSQNITYTSLYDSTTFNRSIVTTLPVGATAGGGSVTSTGGAAYSIPIPVPPGTNGTVPSVALEYNTQSPSSIAGVGWSLSGLSAITRVPRNLYHDGAASPVELSLNDRFAIDGARLILKTGTYGIANSTYGSENETFSTVTAYGAQGNGPLYFKLIIKDGTILEFGNTTDSRFTSEAGNTVMAWRLNKIQNPDGNYIELVYNNTDRDPRISEIRYTGNTAGSIIPYNKIEFAYKIRQEVAPGTFSDIRTVYEAGSSIVSKYLLDKITVKAEGVTIKTYQLGYGNDKVNSYLKSIQEAGADGSLLNSTLFKYGNVPVEEQTSTSTIPSGANIEAFSGDYDGDGVQDIFSGTFTVTDGIRYFSNFKIYKRNQANGSYSLLSATTLDAGYTVSMGRYKYDIPNSSNLLQGDWNGDGLDDVIALNVAIVASGSNWSLNNIKLYKNTSSGSAFTAQSRSIGGRINANGNYFFPGDFNGDGVSEFITILGNSSNVYTPVMHSDFIANGTSTTITNPVPSSIALTDWVNAKIRVLDFNGDGKSDLMLVGATTCEIFTFNGGVATRIYSGNFPLKQDNLYLGDFNGDGKIDVISASTDFASVKKGSSNGVTFNTVTVSFFSPWPSNLDNNPGFYGNEILVGDYNGDGKSDFYYSGLRQKTIPVTDGNEVHNYSSRELYYSTGDSFKQKQLSFDDLVHTEHNLVNNIVPEETTYIGLTPADLNGDGRTDLVSSGGSTLSYRYFNKDGKDNLIQKVLNGLNHTTEWEYKNLTTGGTFYSKGNGTSIYPFNVIQPSLNLVFEVRSQNGLGGNFTTQYSYEGARFHRTGRGFLGFTKTTVTDVAMGIKTISENEFNTTFYTTIPKKTSTYLSSNNSLINEVTLTNVVVSPASKRFWVKTTGISENKALEGAIITTTNVYDEANGNITSSNMVSPVETVATSTIYGAYPGTILNKPTSVTVTKTRVGQSPYTATTTLSYNPQGQLTSKVDFSGKSKAVTTSHTYNTLGNIETTTTSAMGLTSRTNSATFDSKGRYPEKTIDALSQESTAIYDPKWGKPTSLTGIDGLSTTHTYDGFGRVKTTTVNSDYVETNTLSWDISGSKVWKLATTYSQSGRAASTQWFDALGRQVRTETKAFDNGTIEANTVYDAKGNIYSQEQPHKTNEPYIININSFDNFNRPSSVNNGALGTTTFGYSYTAGSVTVTTTTPSGKSYKTTDVAGLVTEANDSGGTLSYTYFSHGGLKEVKNEGVSTTTSEYDEYGQQTKLFDVNAGTTSYTYNAFGELVGQTNPKGGAYTLNYDVLGRITTRVGGSGTEGTTTTEYYNETTSGTSKGKVKKITGFATNNNTLYEYNNRGLLQKVTETIDNVSHVTNYTYNVYGDVLTTTYPSGLVISNSYTSNGYLNTISGAGTTLYTTSSINGQGQVTGYGKGNGKSSTISYTNGFVTAYTTAAVQDYQLVWDYQKGNLTSRRDARSSVNRTETFLYDELDRLTSAKVGTGTAFTATYAANGNISSKKDLGGYHYDNPRLNAVTGFDNPTGVIPVRDQNITYTAFNQPDSVKENNFILKYTYGADYNRIKSELKLNTTVQNTRFYFSGGFEKDITGTTTRYLQYIAGPAGLVAIIESIGTAHTAYYTYTDHLGSILVTTNGLGTIKEEQSFDAWGRRRNPATWQLLPTTATTMNAWLIRGYTGHEHLDKFGLINMNGRLYDPAVGRMLSPDNYVQEPFMTQSFNRYTYAMNNPLIYTDPDGHFWNFVIGAAIGGFSGWQIGKAKGAHGWGMFGYIAGGAAIGAFTSGASEAVLGMFAGATPSLATGAGATVGAYAASGAVGGAISGIGFAGLSGGDIGKGALFGGLIGSATGALGGYIKYNNYSENFRNYLNDPDNWDARVDGPGPKTGRANIKNGVYLSPKTGKPLAEGAVQPNYFFESMYIAGKILPAFGIARTLIQDYRYLSTIRQLGFKELQTLTKTFSPEMNTFFKSEGAATVSRRALLTYKELTVRILNSTGGAPAAKATETAIIVQTQRLNMLNKALALFQ